MGVCEAMSDDTEILMTITIGDIKYNMRGLLPTEITNAKFVGLVLDNIYDQMREEILEVLLDRESGV